MLELIRYVHLNPVRAKLVERVQLYRWSSHHAYSGINLDRWVTTEFGLRMFSEDQPKARAAYREFVNCDASLIPSPLDEISPDRPYILGSDQFAARASKADCAKKTSRTLDSLIREGCERHRLQREIFASGRRHSELACARAWIARQALDLGVATITEIARALGCDPKTIRNVLREYPDCKS